MSLCVFYYINSRRDSNLSLKFAKNRQIWYNINIYCKKAKETKVYDAKP